jgi:dipeptidyl aminopeptidase/acylaminoacyl peptidase
MRVALRCGCLLLVLACPAPALWAEPLVVPLGQPGDVPPGFPQFLVSPDGSRVLFPSAAEPREIRSVPIEGGAAANLTPSGTEGPNLVSVAPDGSRALILARPPSSLFEAFSVPVAGGAASRLHDPLPEGVSASAGPITPDSTRIVLGTRTDCVLITPQRVACPPRPVDLFVAPLAGGGSPVPLTVPDRPLDGPDDLLDFFSVSPNGQLGVSALFERLDPDDSFDPDPVLLFSTPLDGGNATLLDEPNWLDEPFQFTSDSRRVVYNRTGFVGNPRITDLYSLDPAGGPPVKLSNISEGQGGLRFAITPDGAHVVYGARQDRDVHEVYSVPSVGGPITRLSHPEGQEAFPWELAPDGRRVVFAQWFFAGPGIEDLLFSVPVAGGELTRLSPPLVVDPPGDFDSFSPIAAFRVSPDGARVVYVAEQETNDSWDLYSTPVVGGTVTRLGGPIARDGGGADQLASFFRISPDAAHVVFAADMDLDGDRDLHAVPIDGGEPTQLTHTVPPEGIAAFSMEIAGDGRHVVYLVTRPGPGGDELHSARLPPDVAIDVQPRKAHNLLPRGRRAPIAVAILGSEDVDVARVELATLAFGPDGAAPERKVKRTDVDGDGFRDLVTHYRRHETGIAQGDAEACLAGRYDGFEFLSCDEVDTSKR